jgi:CcmD family protein
VEGSLVYLFVAMALTWLLIVGYILALSGRLNGLRRELETLKQRDGWPDDEDRDVPTS